MGPGGEERGMQEAAPGRPLLHLAPPSALLEAWREWSRRVGMSPRLTVTPGALVSRFLLSRLPTSLDHRISTLPEVAWTLRPSRLTYLPDEILPTLLADDVRAAVPAPWRGPGAAEALIEAAVRIRRHGETPDSLPAIPAGWRDAMDVAWSRLARALRRACDETGLYRYAATNSFAPLSGTRMAVFGMLEARPAPASMLAALARELPMTVFVPWLSESADRYVEPWVEWWREQGAHIEEEGRGAGRSHLVGISTPGAGLDWIRTVIEEGARTEPAATGWALAAPSVEEAQTSARWLRRQGVPVVSAREPVHLSERLRTALRAAANDAGADAILTWLRQSSYDIAEADRETLRANARRPSLWPRAVVDRHQDLRQALESLLRAARFSDVPAALGRLAEAAGIPFVWPAEAVEQLSTWDAAGIAPAKDSLRVWIERAAVAGPVTGSGLLVESLWEFRGTYHARLIVTSLDTEAVEPAPEWDLGPGEGWIVAWHPERRARREMALHHLKALALLSADVVYVAGSPDRPWPPDLRPAVVIEEGPSVRGPGLAVSRMRRDARYGPFDGLFDANTITRPGTPSGYETFGRCPLQYAFKTLGVAAWPSDRPDPDPTELGTWAHFTLEHVLSGSRRSRPELPSLLREVRRQVSRAVALRPPSEGVLPAFLEWSEESLAADLAWYLMNDWPTGKVETEKQWELDGLSGRIDRVEHRDDGVVVVDYKTGRMPSAALSPLALQLPIYAAAAANLYGVTPDRIQARYQGVRAHNGFRSVELPGPTTARILEARRIVAGIDDAIAAGHLYLNPHEAACRSCEFRPACTYEAARDAVRKRPHDPVFAALWDDDPDGGEEGL